MHSKHIVNAKFDFLFRVVASVVSPDEKRKI